MVFFNSRLVKDKVLQKRKLTIDERNIIIHKEISKRLLKKTKLQDINRCFKNQHNKIQMGIPGEDI